MVQGIEHIHAELQMQLFRYWEILAQGKIEVPRPRSTNRSVPNIPGTDRFRGNGVDRHPRKRRRVEVPEGGSVIRQDGWPTNIVRAAVCNSRRLTKSYRATGLCRENTRRLPAPERIPQGVPIIQARETVHPFGNK